MCSSDLSLRRAFTPREQVRCAVRTLGTERIVHTHMNVIIVALLVVAIALLALNMRRSQTPQLPSGTTLSQKDIEAALAASQNQALTQIMEQLRRERDAANEEARKAQAEQLRQATDLIVQQGSNQFGTKADAIDQTLRQVAEQMALKMKEIDTALGDLRESSSRQFGKIGRAHV